jgi:uncharacterized protein YndB with AHSA1/START domain
MRAITLVLAMAAAAPASGAVTGSAPDGFVSTSEAVIARPPAAVWALLTNWSAWWDPAHSYSSVPGAMVLEPRAGGTLSERWPGGSSQHAVVVNIMPPALLRLHGGFGPLQSLPVNAILDFALKPEGAGTRLTMTYRIAGSATSKLDALAAPVDAVMSAGFARLVAAAKN